MRPRPSGDPPSHKNSDSAKCLCETYFNSVYFVSRQKKRMDNSGSLAVDEAATRRMQNFPYSGGLYGGLPPTHNEAGAQTHTIHGTALIGGLPMPYPNLAPDVDLTPVAPSTVAMNPAPNPAVFNPEVVNEPKKKKYAKEAWPGKKPTPSLLI